MLLTEKLLERSALTPFVVRDISYIPKLGIVSCFISKNASSFLKTYLYCLSRDSEFSAPQKNPHMPQNTGFKGVEQIGHHRMSAILNDPSVPKIILGRHPVTRLVSAFTSRIMTWQREHYDSDRREQWIVLKQQILGSVRGEHASHQVEALSREVTWSDLVNYVCSTPSVDLNRHLVPQTYFAAVDAIDYNLVGTVENLDCFLSDVCELVGKPLLDPTAEKVNESRAENGPIPSVTDTEKTQIQYRFRRDFDFFGYGAIE